MLRRFFIQSLPQRAPDEEEPSTPLPPARSLITIGMFGSGQKTKTTAPVAVGAAVDSDRTDTYEELRGSSTVKDSVSLPRSGHRSVEMTDLGHKRRQGSDATDKRPLRETF